MNKYLQAILIFDVALPALFIGLPCCVLLWGVLRFQSFVAEKAAEHAEYETQSRQVAALSTELAPMRAKVLLLKALLSNDAIEAATHHAKGELGDLKAAIAHVDRMLAISAAARDLADARVGAILDWIEEERAAPLRVCTDPAGHGDVVLARKDTPASYHLAVVVDDAFQDVTLVTRGEDLRDGPAGVVAHQVHLIESEPLAQVLDHVGHRAGRQVRARRGAAVGREVDGDAAACAGELLDDVPPEHAVRAEAVHEQGDRSVAEFGVGDLAVGCGEVAAVRGEGADVHVSFPLADLYRPTVGLLNTYRWSVCQS